MAYEMEWVEYRASHSLGTIEEALYRLSLETVTLQVGEEILQVPRKVEGLNTKGIWQKHPVVFFRHEGTTEQMLEVFCYEHGSPRLRGYRTGKVALSLYAHAYQEAAKLQLTEGDRVFLQYLVHEEE